MPPDFTVVRYGTDSSSRPVYMTAWMVEVWEAILRDPRLADFVGRLTIVQGAFMTRAGGGASASAGYHDKAGCIDIRTWNLTTKQIDRFILVASEYGFQFWRRDAKHGGFDPHAHGLLGSDFPLASGAQSQLRALLAGRDGLASNGPDYETRFHPLVITPSLDLLESHMPLNDDDLGKIRGIVADEVHKFLSADITRSNEDSLTVRQALIRASGLRQDPPPAA